MKNPFGQKPFASLFRSVLQFVRPTRRISKEQPRLDRPSRDHKGAGIMEQHSLLRPQRDQNRESIPHSPLTTPHSPPAPALSHEQFRRMLEETLAAKAGLCRLQDWLPIWEIGPAWSRRVQPAFLTTGAPEGDGGIQPSQRPN